ncbi:Peroxyureidoacrylate/ureidoacrylate amidohydrolase RutB [Castellaniella defragrans]
MRFPQSVIERVVARQGTLHSHATLNPRTTAFVVVDLQNYYTQPNYQGYCAAAAKTFPAVNTLARELRFRGGTVIWVRTNADGASQFWSHHHQRMLTPERSKRRLLELGSHHQGYALAAELEVLPEDLQVIKRCYSALTPGSSSLGQILHDQAIDTVLIGGTATNVCCESTARDAMMMDYPTIMVHDTLSSFTDGEHTQALHNWMLYFGDVLSVQEVVERFTPRQPETL